MLIYLQIIVTDENKSKFEIIYSTYKNLMLHTANTILGDTRDTEDVVHDAFLKLIEIIEKIDNPKCPKTRNLVVTIVERKAIDLYRKRKRRSIVSMDEEYINVPTPDNIDDVHKKADLSIALATLPTTYRELLLLRYYNGLSEAEVAQILSMSQENVHKTIQRAKKKLEQIMNEKEAYAV